MSNFPLSFQVVRKSIPFANNFHYLDHITETDTRKVKVLSLPETIKEKSTFRAKALRRELVVGGRGKPRVFLYE